MILEVIVMVVLTFAGVALPAASSAGSNRPEGARTETFWRGVLRGDSLFFRAVWIPTTGSASCYQDLTSDADTSVIRRKFIEYRIEDALGGVWHRGVLSEPESQQSCSDELVVEVTPWPGRLIFKLEAHGWGCEPAGSCMATLFIHAAGPDSVAESAWSDWDEIPWDPARGSDFDAWVAEGCFQYPMRLEARVEGAVLEYRPKFPADVNEGDLLVKEVYESDDFGDCLRPFSPKKPTSVAWYRTMDSESVERLMISSGESVQVVSAVIRAERSAAGVLAPRIVRMGVQVSGRRGFVTPADLKTLGFVGL